LRKKRERSVLKTLAVIVLVLAAGCSSQAEEGPIKVGVLTDMFSQSMRMVPARVR
jgi:predicted outer membrane protein